MPIILENDAIELEVLAAFGGKISRLCDRRTGRDWLWKNPHLPLRRPCYGESYINGLDSGGWDEIFPSVSPTHAGGLAMPDHGDLVGLPWEVLAKGDDELHLAVETRFAPCRFERRMSLRGATVRFEYSLENRSGTEIPWLWCAHPLIALEAGMQLRLAPQTVMQLNGGVAVEPEFFPWPKLAKTALPAFDVIPDPTVPGFRPFAAKMFTQRGTTAEFAVLAPDRRSALAFAWNPDELPYLGLWLNCQGWSGCGSAPYFNLGVEPATAPFDDLADAMIDGSARRLAPGEIRHWQLEIRLESSPD